MDSPSKLLADKFKLNSNNNSKDEPEDTTVSCPSFDSSRDTRFEEEKKLKKTSPLQQKSRSPQQPNQLLQGSRGRRLRKLMYEQKNNQEITPHINPHQLKKKEFVDPEMVRELNEVVDKRCCICLEEMRAKTKPEECVHVFCRSCISAWTKTFSNLCPLCKVEIKWLLIYKERTDLECDQEERIDQNEDLKLHEDEIVDRIEVIKPVVNEEVNDWVESFADSCYVCEQGGDEPQLLVCDRCNFNICHTYCCGLDRIPDGDWYCRDCQQQIENQKRRNERRRKSRASQKRKQRDEPSYSEEQICEDDDSPREDITAVLRQSNLYNQSDDDDDDPIEIKNKGNNGGSTLTSRGFYNRSQNPLNEIDAYSRQQQTRSSFVRSRSNLSRQDASKKRSKNRRKESEDEDEIIEEIKQSNSSLEDRHATKPQRQNSFIVPKTQPECLDVSASKIKTPKVNKRRVVEKESSSQISLQQQSRQFKVRGAMPDSQSQRFLNKQPIFGGISIFRSGGLPSQLFGNKIPRLQTSKFGASIRVNFQQYDSLRGQTSPTIIIDPFADKTRESNFIDLVENSPITQQRNSQLQLQSKFSQQNERTLPKYSSPKIQSQSLQVKSKIQHSNKNTDNTLTEQNEDEYQFLQNFENNKKSLSNIKEKNDEQQQTPPVKKTISFRDPTPTKPPIIKEKQEKAEKLMKKRFDLVNSVVENIEKEKMSKQIKGPPLIPIKTSTSSVSKDAYFNIIEESDLLRPISTPSVISHNKTKPSKKALGILTQQTPRQRKKQSSQRSPPFIVNDDQSDDEDYEVPDIPIKSDQVQQDVQSCKKSRRRDSKKAQITITEDANSLLNEQSNITIKKQSCKKKKSTTEEQEQGQSKKKGQRKKNRSQKANELQEDT